MNTFRALPGEGSVILDRTEMNEAMVSLPGLGKCPSDTPSAKGIDPLNGGFKGKHKGSKGMHYSPILVFIGIRTEKSIISGNSEGGHPDSSGKDGFKTPFKTPPLRIGKLPVMILLFGGE